MKVYTPTTEIVRNQIPDKTKQPWENLQGCKGTSIKTTEILLATISYLTGLKTMKILLDGNICQIMQHHKRTWMCNNWPRNKIVGVRKVTGTK